MMRRSLKVSVIAVFASLHAVLYFVSFGFWRNWAIYLAPIEGIVLGPEIGLSAAFLGSLTARMIKPGDPFWMFGLIAEPVSVLVAGMVSTGRWKSALAILGAMLSGYFLHPFGTLLPLWTVIDVLLGLVLIYPATRIARNMSAKNTRSLAAAVAVVSFVCIATDSLVRIFLLVPCGFYSLFPGVFGTFEALYAVFVGAAVSSYIEDAIVVIVSLVVGVTAVVAASRLNILEARSKGAPVPSEPRSEKS